MVVRLLFSVFLAVFLNWFTSTDGRVLVLELQDKYGLERLCEDETTIPSHGCESAVYAEVFRLGGPTFEREKVLFLFSPRPYHVSIVRASARAPPAVPRAPPFAG